MAKKTLDISNLTISSNTLVKNVSQIVGMKISEAYKFSIQSFYKDYPLKSNLKIWSGFGGSKTIAHRLSYRRTYSLFRGLMGVGGKDSYSSQVKNNYYIAGIFVDPMFIPGDPYIKRPPHGLIPVKAEIFERSFSEGIHGYTRNEIVKYNKDKTRKDRYHVGANRAPKRMKPTPELIMKREYNKIFKSIPSLMNEEWEKYLL